MGFARGVTAEGEGGAVAGPPHVRVGRQVRTPVHAAVLVQAADVLRIVVVRVVVERRNVSAEIEREWDQHEIAIGKGVGLHVYQPHLVIC